jgi:translation elongation factor EF-4
MFEVAIQADIGAKIYFWTNVQALRKMCLQSAMAEIFKEKKTSRETKRGEKTYETNMQD